MSSNAKTIVQKYGFGCGRETDFAVNANDFAFSYILVVVKSKSFMVRLRYGDATLFLYYH